MNRLGMFLIGAALTTGGSALASAQALPQNVAYHDRDRARGRRQVDRDHDRDDRRYFDRDHDRRDDRDYGRRFDNGDRRWDGHRWLHWYGRRWIY